jgi:hypothetical protein
MSFSSLLDHTARVWRPTSAKGQLREEVRTHSVVGIFPCTKKRPSARIGDVGPGMAPIGETSIYMEAGADVLERDVIQLLTGPDAPDTFEIDAPPTRPRGHHIELTCQYFLGILPAVPEES